MNSMADAKYKALIDISDLRKRDMVSLKLCDHKLVNAAKMLLPWSQGISWNLKSKLELDVMKWSEATVRINCELRKLK